MTDYRYAGGSKVFKDRPYSKKKASEVTYDDILIIRNRPCRVWGIVPPSTSGDRITFNASDIFNGLKKTRCPYPHEDCEVPHLTRTSYHCIGICMRVCKEKEREHIKGGLQVGNIVFVTVVSTLGEEHIVGVRYYR